MLLSLKVPTQTIFLSVQVKIMKNPDLLHTASEQFLGKKEHEIKSTVLQTLEGHLRAILGTSKGKDNGQ